MSLNRPSALPLPLRALGVPAEFLLTLLDSDTGYFRQVPGWTLNCAVAGAALAELSLQSSVDTDLDRLTLLDDTPTGEPVLDFVLSQITAEPREHPTQYWIERLAQHAELMIDLTLDRLQSLQVLEHHDGGFWTLTSDFRIGTTLPVMLTPSPIMCWHESRRPSFSTTYPIHEISLSSASLTPAACCGSCCSLTTPLNNVFVSSVKWISSAGLSLKPLRRMSR